MNQPQKAQKAQSSAEFFAHFVPLCGQGIRAEVSFEINSSYAPLLARVLTSITSCGAASFWPAGLTRM